jgi:hypothetical protein
MWPLPEFLLSGATQGRTGMRFTFPPIAERLRWMGHPFGWGWLNEGEATANATTKTEADPYGMTNKGQATANAEADPPLREG